MSEQLYRTHAEAAENARDSAQHDAVRSHHDHARAAYLTALNLEQQAKRLEQAATERQRSASWYENTHPRQMATVGNRRVPMFQALREEADEFMRSAVFARQSAEQHHNRGVTHDAHAVNIATAEASKE